MSPMFKFSSLDTTCLSTILLIILCLPLPNLLYNLSLKTMQAATMLPLPLPTCPFHPTPRQLSQLCPCNTLNLGPLTISNYLMPPDYASSSRKTTRLRIRISLSFRLCLSLPCLWHKSKLRSKLNPLSLSSPLLSSLDLILSLPKTKPPTTS